MNLFQKLLYRMVLVKVTQEHIDKGCIRQSSNCPIALAIREAIDNTKDCSVGNLHYSIWEKDVSSFGRLIELPCEVIIWIDDYDHHKKVKPFEFEIELPI